MSPIFLAFTCVSEIDESEVFSSVKVSITSKGVVPPKFLIYNFHAFIDLRIFFKIVDKTVFHYKL